MCPKYIALIQCGETHPFLSNQTVKWNLIKWTWKHCDTRWGFSNSDTYHQLLCWQQITYNNNDKYNRRAIYSKWPISNVLLKRLVALIMHKIIRKDSFHHVTKSIKACYFQNWPSLIFLFILNNPTMATANMRFYECNSKCILYSSC